MKIERREDGQRERKIVEAMVSRKGVLGPISSRWKKGMFGSDASDLVAGWCVEHWKKYGKAPGKASVEAMAFSWSEKQKDGAKVELVGQLLGSLEDPKGSSRFLVDLAGQHFNELEKSRFSLRVQAAVDLGQWDKVDQAVRDLRRIELGSGSEIDVMQDEKAWQAALDYSKKPPLVRYPGALGQFFAGVFSQGSFVAFQGPEGRGKSFFLIDFAHRAACQRKRTLFFALGDMTQDQVMGRFLSRAARRPLHPRTVPWPKKIVFEGKDCRVDRSDEVFEKGLSIQDAEKSYKDLMRKRIHSKEPFLKLRTHPAGTLSVADIKGAVEDLVYRDWIPDAVVIDYADLILPPSGVKDGRDKVNAIWEQLRALSTWGHLPAVITATQTNRESYKANRISRHHVSEDKRKLAHVSAMIGINVLDEEKRMGACRLNLVKLREEEFLEGRFIYLAGALAVANPCILSSWRPKKGETDDD